MKETLLKNGTDRLKLFKIHLVVHLFIDSFVYYENNLKSQLLKVSETGAITLKQHWTFNNCKRILNHVCNTNLLTPG